MKYLFSCLFLLCLWSSCDSGDTAADDPLLTEEPAEIKSQPIEERIDPAPVPDPYQIKNGMFYGVRPGGAIEDLPIKVEEGILQTGEGDFEVYYILDELDGQRLGYFTTAPGADQRIGPVTITTPKATTVDGLGIGSTYAKIKELMPNHDVHGSEIEARTHVEYGKIALRLDHASTEYSIESSKIPNTTQVLEITLLP